VWYAAAAVLPGADSRTMLLATTETMPRRMDAADGRFRTPQGLASDQAVMIR